jgi:hypothetical protein
MTKFPVFQIGVSDHRRPRHRVNAVLTGGARGDTNFTLIVRTDRVKKRLQIKDFLNIRRRCRSTPEILRLHRSTDPFAHANATLLVSFLISVFLATDRSTVRIH